MPAGNFFLYLNHDDHTDMRALATVESVSRPLRGEFIRAASVAGAVLYRIDVRLPTMLCAMFASTIKTSQFFGVLALLRGTGGNDASGEVEACPWLPGRYTGPSQRRRLMLQLDEGDVGAGLVIPILDDASDRQRITLLRSLIIAGCVLHELDPRFPRLLASMPQHPETLKALNHLAEGLLREKGPQLPGAVQQNIIKKTKPEINDGTHISRENLKKIF